MDHGKIGITFSLNPLPQKDNGCVRHIQHKSVSLKTFFVYYPCLTCYKKSSLIQ